MGRMASQITSLTIVCLLKRLFRRRSKITSKLRITGLCEGNSPVNDDFPTQRASNAENLSIRWRHHEEISCEYVIFQDMLFRNIFYFVFNSLRDEWVQLHTHAVISRAT